MTSLRTCSSGRAAPLVLDHPRCQQHVGLRLDRRGVVFVLQHFVGEHRVEDLLVVEQRVRLPPARLTQSDFCTVSLSASPAGCRLSTARTPGC